MTKEIKQIIEAGESEIVEFKETTGQLSSAVETLCAFGNHKGGTLIFGVSDKGKIIGQTVTDSSLRDVSDAILRSISPTIYPSITKEEIDGKSLIVVTVPEVTTKPHTANGRPYKKVGSTTRPMAQQEYERLLIERNRHVLYWDKEANDFPISEINGELLRHFIRTAQNVRRLDISDRLPVKEILMGLDMMNGKKLTNAAIALFGKNARRRFMQLEVKVARFKGINKDEFVDNRILKGNLFELYDKVDNFLADHIRIAGKVPKGFSRRIDTPEYPLEALREAVLNAFIHRDYYNQGGSAEVAIYDDRIEIWNNGHLPADFTVKTLYRPHRSVLRNPLLAQAFFFYGAIEKWGRGTLKMLELCKAAGLPMPEFNENSGGLEVRFISGKKNQNTQPIAKLNPKQQKIVEYIKKKGEARTNELADFLGVSRTAVQNNLKHMRELIKWTGKTSNDPHGKYVLK